MKYPVITVDKVISSLLILCGLIYLVGSRNLSLGTLKSPGEGLIPIITGFLLIVFSLIIFFRSQLVSDEKLETSAKIRVIKIALTIVVYVLLLPVVGFKIMTLCTTVYATRILGNTNWKTNLLFGFGTVFVAALLFQVWLKLPLPEPILKTIGL